VSTFETDSRDPEIDKRPVWSAEFPYSWDTDDLVSRRQLLRLAVLASGALFTATAVLAGLGFVRARTIGTRQMIVNAADVPLGGVHYFDYPNSGEEALLLHLADGQFVAYSGTCTHLSCAVYWESDGGRLRCPCHDGEFSPQTGYPIAGPPNRPLPKIMLEQQNGVLYAVKEIIG
jgi:Rieske Fe-S protein